MFVFVPGVQFVMQTAAPPWMPALIPPLIGGIIITAYNVGRQAFILKYPKSRISKAINW